MSSGHGEIVFQVLRRISKSTGLSEVQGFARSSITNHHAKFSELILYSWLPCWRGGTKSGVWSILFVRPSRFPPAKFVNTTSPSRRSKSEMVLKSLDWIGKGLCIRVQLCLYVIRWRHHRLLKLERQYNVGFSFQPKGDSGNLLCEWTLTVYSIDGVDNGNTHSGRIQ